MPAIHVRHIDDAVLSALKTRAQRNRRSLQGEVRSILEAAATTHAPPARKSRRLQLKTVHVGSRATFSRDELYDNDR